MMNSVTETHAHVAGEGRGGGSTGDYCLNIKHIVSSTKYFLDVNEYGYMLALLGRAGEATA